MFLSVVCKIGCEGAGDQPAPINTQTQPANDIKLSGSDNDDDGYMRKNFFYTHNTYSPLPPRRHLFTTLPHDLFPLLHSKACYSSLFSSAYTLLHSFFSLPSPSHLFIRLLPISTLFSSHSTYSHIFSSLLPSSYHIISSISHSYLLFHHLTSYSSLISSSLSFNILSFSYLTISLIQ